MAMVTTLATDWWVAIFLSAFTMRESGLIF